MRRLARERHLNLVVREIQPGAATRAKKIRGAGKHGEWMHHEARVHIFVCSRVDEEQLSTTTLFGWSPQKPNRIANSIGVQTTHCFARGQESRDRTCSDQIVSACMSHAGKGIVFCVEGNGTSTLAVAMDHFKRRFNSIRFSVNLVSIPE